MTSIYMIVQLLHDWHLKELSPYEKKFIKSMYEGVKGLGNNPTDKDVIEGNGLSTKQVSLIRTIGKRFLIK